MKIIDQIVDQRPAVEGQFNGNFDGLRAVAALMVMAMHIKTIPPLAGGAPGVWLFFTLSGYLLYCSFLRLSNQVNSNIIMAYMIRRVFRIIPLYLVFVFVYAYIFKGWSFDQKNSFLIVQAFFLKDTLHLWTVKQEMIFYLVLPLIMMSFYFIKSTGLRSFILIFGAVLAIYLHSTYDLSFFSTRAHVACFLLGMAAVHVKQYVPNGWSPYIAYASIALILILCLFVQWNLPIRKFLGILSREHIHRNSFVFFPLCFLLVMSLSQFSSRFWGNRYLRLLGVVGYGFYLWHPLTCELVRGWQLSNKIVYQFCAYSLTFSLALATYFIIEKPGINLGRHLAIWVRDNNTILKIFRPWMLCMMALVIFLSYRQIYLQEPMKVQFTMWSSTDTVVQLFIDSGDGFSMKKSGTAEIMANKWNRVGMNFRDAKIEKLRFDPGAAGGTYKIKDVSINTRFGKNIQLDLSKFTGHRDIKSIEYKSGTLDVVTISETKDPVLIYQGSTNRFLTINKVLLVVGMVSTLLLIVLLTIWDSFVFARQQSPQR